MAESIIDYACRVQDIRNGLEGRHQTREVVLQAIAEVDLTLQQRRALIERLQAAGVV